jgi:ABC-type xylose transport system substrate-binding protein
MTEPKMTLEEARALEDELTGLAAKALDAVLAEKTETIKAITALTMGLGQLLLVASADDEAAEMFADEMARQLKAYVRNDRNKRIARQARDHMPSSDIPN